MKSVVSCQLSVVSLRKVVLFYCLLLAAYCSLSCSVPNLEKPECTKARQTLKELYSFHFGNDMKFTKENLQTREKFLSEQLKLKLGTQPDSAKDYFTATDSYPKTFRVGVCKITEPEKKVEAQILLFWREGEKTEQREVKAEVINENDKWLVSSVSQQLNQ